MRKTRNVFGVPSVWTTSRWKEKIVSCSSRHLSQPDCHRFVMMVVTRVVSGAPMEWTQPTAGRTSCAGTVREHCQLTLM